MRKKFTCNKNTSLEELLELLRGLEVMRRQLSRLFLHTSLLFIGFDLLIGLFPLQMEREKIKENKRQVQHLVANSKNIVRLKPRNPEEKSSSPVIVKALCDFMQDQVGLSLTGCCQADSY